MGHSTRLTRATMVRAIMVLGVLAALPGCGGGDAGNGGGNAVVPPGGITPTPTPTPTPALTEAEIVAQSLRIDIDHPDNYANPDLPAFYDDTIFELDNTPDDNPITNQIATLGRVLFYDTKLSVNDTIACATCHKQAMGFDDDEALSTGLDGRTTTTAHAPRLGNLRFYQSGEMFWNKRAASAEEQATVPIKSAVEMGWDEDAGGIAALTAKMQGLDYYPILFRFAFGTPAITETRIQRALAQFERAMISSGSRWDRAYAQVFNADAPNRNLDLTFPGFTASETLGKRLFTTRIADGGAGCGGCHRPPTFALTANSLSNGLDAGETTIFKSPALKNVGLSKFFMHDGRFTSLRQVVDFYDNGIQDGPALDNRLKQGDAPQRLGLNETEKQALVDFMETLTDRQLTRDRRFSDPFIN